MTAQPIQHLIIAGGGSAGWMAAAALAKYFQGTALKISLVESPEIGTIGVGEATIPTIRQFYRRLGLTDGEVMLATEATAKLGIGFDHWLKPGHRFIHPFGRFGEDLNRIPFHQHWLKAHRAGVALPMERYSLPIQLARANKFTTPAAKSQSLSLFDWALHLDASKFGALMRKVATGLGVRHIEGTIAQVRLKADNGHIDSLLLEDGRSLAGELYIDCTGFNGRLISQALQVPFDSWADQLLCDSAVVAQSPLSRPDAPPSYTEAHAHSAGWQWKIPLQSRQGNGHVYARDFMSDDQAAAQLRDQAGADLSQEPRLIRFTPGRRARAWEKNCICLGLAAGFVEPLESTAIALIETGIEKIKLLFPDQAMNPALRDEFNDMTRLEYERVRDFIMLHYSLNQRTGEPFWDAARALARPDTLEKKLALFKARGHLLKCPWEIFQPFSWLALFTGFDFLPDSYDPAVDASSEQQLASALAAMRHAIDQAVAQTPTHQQFLNYLQEARHG